jgi:hypothetical protein
VGFLSGDATFEQRSFPVWFSGRNPIESGRERWRGAFRRLPAL